MKKFLMMALLCGFLTSAVIGCDTAPSKAGDKPAAKTDAPKAGDKPADKPAEPAKK